MSGSICANISVCVVASFCVAWGWDSYEIDRLRRRKIEIYPQHFNTVRLNQWLWIPAGVSSSGRQGVDHRGRP